MERLYRILAVTRSVRLRIYEIMSAFFPSDTAPDASVATNGALVSEALPPYRLLRLKASKPLRTKHGQWLLDLRPRIPQRQNRPSIPPTFSSRHLRRLPTICFSLVVLTDHCGIDECEADVLRAGNRCPSSHDGRREVRGEKTGLIVAAGATMLIAAPYV